MFLLIEQIQNAVYGEEDFNTSHVSINLINHPRLIDALVFQYISCFY